MRRADPDLGVAVRGAMKKIESVLPEPLQASMPRTALFGPPYRVRNEATGVLRKLRRAIGTERWAALSYVDGDGAQTERTVVPLGLYFWGRNWLLAAYCLLRSDYRSFRVDRITSFHEAGAEPARIAGLEPPVSLDGYVRAMEAKHQAELAAGSACVSPEGPASGAGEARIGAPHEH